LSNIVVDNIGQGDFPAQLVDQQYFRRGKWNDVVSTVNYAMYA